MKATIKDAYKLIHEGALALSSIEEAGMCIDVSYLKQTIRETKEEIKQLGEELKGMEEYKLQKKRYGDKTNIGSRQQLAEILFGHYRYEIKTKTKTGRAKMDETVLEDIGTEYTTRFLRIEKLKKLEGTYLQGVLRETVNGLLHPFFNLHLATSYRSCVAKGTLIETVRDVSKYPKGVIIENVRAGDYVYCYDDDLNLSIRKVLWAGKTGHRNVIRLHWKARGKKGHLDVTPEHRIRLSDGRYVRADQLHGDLRSSSESVHSYKIRCLAMGRIEELLWQTGSSEPIYDHRLVYETLIGELNQTEVIHHKDKNHLNNTPSNLQKMTRSEHSREHCSLGDSLTDEVRRKGIRKRIKNHQMYGDRWKSGEECPSWVRITKYQLLKMLASNSGKVVKINLDFETAREKARILGVDLKIVKDRYDRNGEYISLGKISRTFDGRLTSIVTSFGINHQKARRMLTQRGIEYKDVGPSRNPYGRKGLPHNHRITRIEYINREVDVYDIEVEELHNFIASEICVHNSCDHPNFQNIPTRDPEIAKKIRSAFIPREGHHLVEIDYSALEFRVAACFWKDPKMVAYASDHTLDIHRDCAAEIWMCEREDITKTSRYCSKNMFVFPQIYGDFFINCAKSCWEAAERMDLEVGVIPMRGWLEDKGIVELGLCDSRKPPLPGTFEKHMKEVEETFYRWFPEFSKSKEEWWETYQKRGWFDLLTGFRVQGVHRKNYVFNCPIQGPAFHLLLWSLTRIVKWLKKNKMKTKIIGQIHDSLVLDCHEKELQDVINKTEETMTKDVKKHWDWIVTPLEVEVEVANTNWFEKTPLIKKNGTWKTKSGNL